MDVVHRKCSELESLIGTKTARLEEELSTLRANMVVMMSMINECVKEKDLTTMFPKKIATLHKYIENNEKKILDLESAKCESESISKAIEDLNVELKSEEHSPCIIDAMKASLEAKSKRKKEIEDTIGDIPSIDEKIASIKMENKAQVRIINTYKILGFALEEESSDHN